MLIEFIVSEEVFRQRIRDGVLSSLHDAQELLINGSTLSRINTWHVSDFVSPCLRKSYYSHIRKLPQVLDDKKRRILFHGLIVHEHTQLAKFHEITMCYDILNDVAVQPEIVMKMNESETKNIVTGTCDDLMKIDNEFVLVDKKTWSAHGYVKTIPNEEYVKQLNIYRVLLNESYGIDPKWGCLMFLDKSDDLCELPMEFPLAPINETKQFMRDALRQLNSEPPPNPCWLCNGQNRDSRIYCDYLDICNKEGRAEIFRQKIASQYT